MHRVVAILVGFAFVGAAGPISRLHTHAYTGHDHPEHQHDLASHEHQSSEPGPTDDDTAVHLESCGAGQHQVSHTIGFAPAHESVVPVAEPTYLRAVDPLVVVCSVHTLTDVRVHGPPPLEYTPTRAPPQIFPA